MVISGLASLLGLGGIADKIKKILETIQKPVGKVVDGIIGGVVKYGKKLLGKLKRKKKGAGDADLAPAVREATTLLGRDGTTTDVVRASLPTLRERHGLKVAELLPAGAEGAFKIHVQKADESTPPRYISNRPVGDGRTQTRTYCRSVSQLRGEAGQWADRMRADGWQVVVPPIRTTKYGGADITVTATKGNRESIRHFIVRK
jgi:hypothetical protein